MGDQGGSSPIGGGRRRAPAPDALLRPHIPVVPPAPKEEGRPRRVAGDPNTLEGSSLRPNADYRRRAFFSGEGVGFEFFVPRTKQAGEFFDRLSVDSGERPPPYRRVVWQGETGFVPAGQYGEYAAAAGVRLNQTTSGRSPQ